MRFCDLRKVEALCALLRQRLAGQADAELRAALEAAAEAAQREREILTARSSRQEEFFSTRFNDRG